MLVAYRQFFRQLLNIFIFSSCLFSNQALASFLSESCLATFSNNLESFPPHEALQIKTKKGHSELVTQQLFVLVSASNPAVKRSGPESKIIQVGMNHVYLLPDEAVDSVSPRELKKFIDQLNNLSQKPDSFLRDYIPGHQRGDIYAADPIIDSTYFATRFRLLRIKK